MQLFISPHLDDTALSCGGLIHQLTQGGESVTMLTVMAGDAPSPLPESELINLIHTRWDVGDNPPFARRQEDECAAQVLVATLVHEKWQDCIYRVGREGSALYTTGDSIFGDISPDDSLDLGEFAPFQTRQAVTLYVPLAVGNHVDHQFVHQWTWGILKAKERYPSLTAIKFYEDYPYISWETGEAQRERRVSALSAAFSVESEMVILSEANVDAKLRAIACYTSQISSFYTDFSTLEQNVRQTMLRTGEGVCAERYWSVL
jgi:LmbE family N-acetylglucosaminyl deacetylase